MLQAIPVNSNNNPDEWAERGDYWLKKLNPIPQYKARKRRIIHRPLVLSGHGIRVRIDSGTLLITCGFTHFPQKKEEYRFFPKDRQLPSRIIILDGDGHITFDALEWMSEQDLPLIQIDWRGQISCVGRANYAANPEFVQHQLQLKSNGKGFDFAKELISQKIKNSYETIKYISENAPEAQLILQQLETQTKNIKNTPPIDVSSLLAVEGNAAATCFRYLYTLPLRWKGLGRKPIPPEWFSIGTRISVNDANRFARHPINAILNYAYGILENQVRAQILIKGLDPTIGFIHSNVNNRHSFVFDVMEPVRPIMDRHVLEFIKERTFSPSDFILDKNGVCRLHPQFARFIVKSVQDIKEIELITVNNLKNLLLLK